MKRVLVVTLGSLGDLYPLLQLCRELGTAGVEVRLAAPAIYASECCDHDVEFVGLGAGVDYAASVGHAHRGRENSDGIAIAERLAFDSFDASFEQIYEAAVDVDLIVTVLHAISAHLVAEKLGIPYAVVVLSPAFTVRALQWSPTDDDAIKVPARWNARLAELRKRHGLSRRILPYQAIFHGAAALLGMFPKFLLNDRPHVENLQVVGHAQPGVRAADSADEELAEFCRERPVVFSFGSYVDACDPDYFFSESVAACRALDLRCLYISRHVSGAALAAVPGRDLLTRPFVPHALAFSQASATVHHGGLGTLIEACNSANPMVIVPFMHDQPYHAERMLELVGAPLVPSREYRRDRIAQALQQVLTEPGVIRRKLQALMAGESKGATRAAAEIQKLLTSRPDSTGTR